jgi:hypothetical protein
VRTKTTKPNFKLIGLLFLASIFHNGLTWAESVATVSFGRISPDEEISQIIEFANPTASILEIEAVTAPPPLVAEILTPAILPGMNGAIKVSLGERDESGFVERVIQISFKNSGYPTVDLAIEWYDIPPIEFRPLPALFVATHRGRDRTASIEILNHRDEPLVLLPVRSDTNRYSLELNTLEEGQHYRLSLTLDGEAAVGEQRDELILRADPPLERPLKVQLNTKVRERVYHFPNSVDMGALPSKVSKDPVMTETLSQILMVYRPDTDDFEVEASIDLDYIDMTVERGPKGDRYQMDLTLIPEKVKPGKIEGTVTIKTNDKEFPVLEVPVTGWILE